MKSYRYEGISVSGTRVEGVVEAFDEQEAVIRAKADCRIVASVTPVAGPGADILNTDIGALLAGGRIKDKQLSLLCSQLAIELKAGLPLVRSLQLVAENEGNKTLRRILKEVAEDVQSGHGLADSFAARGPQLPDTFIQTIRVGEASGRLDESFARLRKFYTDQASINSKIISAMIYPIMLILTAVVVVAIIMIKAVPVFEESFSSMGDQLPAITWLLIRASHFFNDYWLITLIILGSVILGVQLLGRTHSGQKVFSGFLLTFPGIDLVTRMGAAATFCSTLGTMLRAGLPMVQATGITADVMDNTLIAGEIRAARQGILEGRRLGDGLKKSQWLPNLLLEMVAVGEETGNLEETLDVVNTYYTQELEMAVNRALRILEPVIILVMAGVVVGILLSVYLPLFSLYGSI